MSWIPCPNRYAPLTAALALLVAAGCKSTAPPSYYSAKAAAEFDEEEASPASQPATAYQPYAGQAQPEATASYYQPATNPAPAEFAAPQQGQNGPFNSHQQTPAWQGQFANYQPDSLPGTSVTSVPACGNCNSRGRSSGGMSDLPSCGGGC